MVGAQVASTVPSSMRATIRIHPSISSATSCGFGTDKVDDLRKVRLVYVVLNLVPVPLRVSRIDDGIPQNYAVLFGSGKSASNRKCGHVVNASLTIQSALGESDSTPPGLNAINLSFKKA